jgi:chromosome segregation ATPase
MSILQAAEALDRLAIHYADIAAARDALRDLGGLSQFRNELVSQIDEMKVEHIKTKDSLAKARKKLEAAEKDCFDREQQAAALMKNVEQDAAAKAERIVAVACEEADRIVAEARAQAQAHLAEMGKQLSAMQVKHDEIAAQATAKTSELAATQRELQSATDQMQRMTAQFEDAKKRMQEFLGR